ncbi:MAG: hypothetical protein OXB93_06745 [Cytophagales bacterium]|nr:hypothetical protein [Cytophagales bacterium]
MKGRDLFRFLLEGLIGFAFQACLLWVGFYFSYALAFVYLACLLHLPFRLSSFWRMILGMSMGLGIDLMYGTIGLHGIACLGMTFVQRRVGQFYFPLMERKKVQTQLNPYALGSIQYAIYAITLILLHHSILFILEAAMDVHWRDILKIGLSSLFTLFLLLSWYGIGHVFLKKQSEGSL